MGDGIPVWYRAFTGMFYGVFPALLIGGIISVLFFGYADMECKYSQELIPLKEASSTSEAVFLVSGQSDSHPCYIYMVETDQGLKQIEVMQLISNVYIRHTNKDKAYVGHWDREFDIWRILSKPPYYVFYLPKGSTIDIYDMNIEEKGIL